MKFVKLTANHGGEKLYVNADNVFSIEPSEDGGSNVYSITIAQGVFVREAPKEIVAMIESLG